MAHEQSFLLLAPPGVGKSDLVMDAAREAGLACRSLLGTQIAPEDVWEGCHFVLSVKLQDPQFSGQTKERLSSRECVAFVSGVAKDSFSHG